LSIINSQLPIWLFCVLLTFIGCKPAVVKETEQTLAVADSLRLKGIAPTDSALWAETVASLTPWRYFYPTDYAKANFYYGFLLRMRSHYPESMQCFIDVTKSRTKEYAWKAKAWTNMGDFCRLEGNYDLAYEMHVHAADCFRRDSNMRAYYYEINNQALQRALQKDKSAAYELLSIIERECTDSAVLTKALETKAIACRYVEEHDSALYYAIRLQANGNREPTGYMIKAQVYSKLGIADSAVYYAQYIMEHSTSKTDKYNALYILSHKDKDLSNDSVLTLTSQRADFGTEYTRRQESLSHAVEILQQELSRPYDWRWIYIVLGIITLIGGCIGIQYAIRSHRLMKKFDIEMYATLEEKCGALQKMTERQLITTIYWDNYTSMCGYLNAHMNNFVNKLLVLNNTLTEQNIRLGTLILIGCSYKRTASLLNLSENSMSKLKQILADKLGTKIKDLHTFLLTLASKNSSSLS